jgi:hypothetical protein
MAGSAEMWSRRPDTWVFQMARVVWCSESDRWIWQKVDDAGRNAGPGADVLVMCRRCVCGAVCRVTGDDVQEISGR